ncbi:MAG: tetratricopeptide (TPR) repeat protein [Oceanicoccus sp.]|jgi:tetratricopeptide (TPR) repeat protein
MDQNKKSYLALLKKQKKEKDWDSMLVSSQEAIKVLPNEKCFWRELHFAQSHYVDDKLSSDFVHDLEKKGDYESLLKVYHRLVSIFPESKKLQKRIKTATIAKDKQSSDEQKDIIDAAKKRIEELMKEGKYDDSLNACYEVLSHIPTHKACLKLKKKILNKREKNIDKELGPLSIESYNLVQLEYKENKKSIIKL